MSVSRREYCRVREIIEPLGWRVLPTQKTGRNKSKNPVTAHVHSLAWPPLGTPGKPVIMGTSNDPRALPAMYADFRRYGIELDPQRQQQTAAKARRACKQQRTKKG